MTKLADDDAAANYFIFQLEALIHQKIRATSTLSIKDSDVKSALVKATSLVQGKSLASTPKTPVEVFVFDLAKILSEQAQNLSSGPLPKGWYVAALQKIAQSLTTRREMAGHSRGYIEFLEGFMARAPKNDLEKPA